MRVAYEASEASSSFPEANAMDKEGPANSDKRNIIAPMMAIKQSERLRI